KLVCVCREFIDACLAVLCHATGPFSKITCIDELDGIVWLSRRQHVSGTIDTHWPIRKAVALVAGTDDKPRANAQGFSGKPFLGFAFRERLERSVGFESGRAHCFN